LNIIQNRYNIHNKIKKKAYRGKFGDPDIENTRFENPLHQKEESTQYIMLGCKEIRKNHAHENSFIKYHYMGFNIFGIY